MQEKELAKQVSTYADAITGFAFVQCIATAVLLAQNPQFVHAIVHRWYVAVPITLAMTAVYSYLLNRCHKAEDDLLGVLGERGDKIAKVVPAIRSARKWIVWLSGVSASFIFVGARLWPVTAKP
jgi:hypothetical protein